MVFRFLGTEASIRLNDRAQFFSVFLDGKPEPRLETTKGEKAYPLASNLPMGQHEVRLYRRTEGSFGPTVFLGLELGQGQLLAPPPPKPRRLEIIGDSITAGFGNEGTSATCPFSADTENHNITYGAIAARNLNADLITIAWSGKGVIFNYGDDKKEPLPEIYDRILANQPQPKWSFEKWQPHAVVINLGTNDFSTGGDPTESEFVGAYEAFAKKLRGYYPKARILCMLPSFLSGNDLSLATGYINKVVQKRAAAGDSNIAVIDPAFTSDGWGCAYHPSAKTHASLGAGLTMEIKKQLGW